MTNRDKLSSPPERVVRATPYNIARRAAPAEVKGYATTEDIDWLYAHPLLWLRALIALRRRVENHIAKDRLSMTAHKPGSGANQAEWLRAKHRHDIRIRDRLHFLDLVKERIEEVKPSVGSERADRMIVGDVIADMLDLAQIADEGDLDGAREKARFLPGRSASAGTRSARR